MIPDKMLHCRCTLQMLQQPGLKPGSRTRPCLLYPSAGTITCYPSQCVVIGTWSGSKRLNLNPALAYATSSVLTAAWNTCPLKRVILNVFIFSSGIFLNIYFHWKGRCAKRRQEDLLLGSSFPKELNRPHLS